MKTVPTIGSDIEVSCKFYTGVSEFAGTVITPYKWLSADEFCLQTGNKAFPISVINLKSVVDLKIIKGSTTKTRKFKIKGSKDHEYLVTLVNDNYSCSCIGFKYHSKCKHITKVKETITK
jgi:hypothetical protein